MTLFARRRGRAVLFIAAIAASILMAPRQAAAWQCPETWNPATKPPPGDPKFTGVPAGWSTYPGTKDPKTPVNPDGFFKILGSGLTLTDGCACDPGVAGFGGSDYDDKGTCQDFPAPSGGWPSEFEIKYTEANGIEAPKVDAMAANNGGGNGNATYIDYHLWGAGDLKICNADGCICCPVPPPPFTCGIPGNPVCP